MRYDEMQQLYPWIEDLFAIVADRIYKGSTSERAMESLHSNHRIILDRIVEQHQETVIKKLVMFAEAAWKNNAYVKAHTPEIPPTGCAYCGSLDTSSGICIWCHNELAG